MLTFIIIFCIFVLLSSKKPLSILGCGLIGFIGTKKFDPNLLKILFLYNRERGEDSCGYYCNDEIVKKVGSVEEVLIPTFNPVPDNLFIGHTRKKTVGAATEENAHPFHYKDKIEIIGAHNGTISNRYDLNHYLDYSYQDFDVDTQLIFHEMAKSGEVKILGNVKGGTAVIYIDKDKPGMLFAFRNDERPLFRGKVENGVFLSSLENSLQAIGCKGIMELSPYYLYSIDSKGAVVTKRVKKDILRYVPETTTPRSMHNSQYSNYGGAYGYEDDYDDYNCSIMNNIAHGKDDEDLVTDSKMARANRNNTRVVYFRLECDELYEFSVASDVYVRRQRSQFNKQLDDAIPDLEDQLSVLSKLTDEHSNVYLDGKTYKRITNFKGIRIADNLGVLKAAAATFLNRPEEDIEIRFDVRSQTTVILCRKNQRFYGRFDPDISSGYVFIPESYNMVASSYKNYVLINDKHTNDDSKPELEAAYVSGEEIIQPKMLLLTQGNSQKNSSGDDQRMSLADKVIGMDIMCKAIHNNIAIKDFFENMDKEDKEHLLSIISHIDDAINKITQKKSVLEKPGDLTIERLKASLEEQKALHLITRKILGVVTSFNDRLYEDSKNGVITNDENNIKVMQDLEDMSTAFKDLIDNQLKFIDAHIQKKEA